jgi:1-phosphatidylinositol-4-phosphate 5-kinase
LFTQLAPDEKDSDEGDEDISESSEESNSNAAGTTQIGFGSYKWKLVLEMQIAIRISSQIVQFRPFIHPFDFDTTVQFKIPNPNIKEKSNFIDYAPMVFRHIRQICGISEQSYMYSVGPEQVLGNLLLGNLTSFTEKLSDGKSGSFFFYSHDEKFMIKSIPNSEFEVMLKILPDYYNHIKQHGNNTLLMKILACYQLNDQVFIVLGNLFASAEKLSTIYDLKGSTIGRANPNGFVKKDNDLKQSFPIGTLRDEIINQMHHDVIFLQNHSLLDYSLLVGVHEREANAEEKAPKTNLLSKRIESSDGKQVYYIGIIDLLTEFNDRKKLEYVGKSIIHPVNSSQLSVQHPKAYGQRFIEYMERIFK